MRLQAEHWSLLPNPHAYTFQCVQIEIAAIPTPAGKLARIFRITRIFAAELLGTFSIVPYGESG